MSTTINLNCWTHGEDLGHIFPVEIAATKTVGALKNAIKEKKRPAFDHVPAYTLKLWKVTIPADEDLEDNLKKLNLDDLRPLSPLAKLSTIFAGQSVDDHLDIIVGVPPTG
jgi:hypothetical protein